MCWTPGTGLGKTGDGILEPVEAVAGSVRGEGLGYRKRTADTKPKELMALSWVDEEGNEKGGETEKEDEKENEEQEKERIELILGLLHHACSL